MTHHWCNSGQCRTCALIEEVGQAVFELFDDEIDCTGELAGELAAAAEKAVSEHIRRWEVYPVLTLKHAGGN